MGKQILVIKGSPRKNGNTSAMAAVLCSNQNRKTFGICCAECDTGAIK